MDNDEQSSSKVMSGNGNDNGQSDNTSNGIMEQSNVSVQNSSCLDPSNGNVNSHISSDHEVLNSSVMLAMIVTMPLVMTVR